MILGSCLATPAFAAQPGSLSDPGLMENFSETSDENIISQTTKQLPLTESNMIQNEETITTYKDGTEITDTITVVNIPTFPASNSYQSSTGTQAGTPFVGTSIVSNTKDIKKNQKVVAKFTITAFIQYNSIANTTKCIYKNKNSWVDSKHTIKKFDLKVLSGKKGGKSWTSVKANCQIYAKGIPAISSFQTLEAGAYSNGKLK